MSLWFHHMTSTLLPYDGIDSAPVTVSRTLALLYSLGAATSFVSSLYVLVPSQVRCLSRNDKLQIQWRALATSIVCVASSVAFSVIFPTQQQQSPVAWTSIVHSTVLSCMGVLGHVTILYFGPLAQGALQIYIHLKRTGKDVTLQSIRQTYHDAFMEPYWSSLILGQGSSVICWINLRNLVIAPFTEEFVFRGCIVRALEAVTENPWGAVSLCWIAPLFFGVAHLHHAFQRLFKDKEAALPVILQTLFQFTYTTLFGAYTSYAYLRTKSLLAVVLSHSFCNYMGLPTCEFAHKSSLLFAYRHWLWAAHLLGITGFLWGLKMR